MSKIYGQLMKCNGFIRSYLLASSDKATEYCGNNCFLYSPLNFQQANCQTGVGNTWDHGSITSLTCDHFFWRSSVVPMLSWSKQTLLLQDSVTASSCGVGHVPSCKITKVDLSIRLEFLVLNVVPYAEFLRHMTLPGRAKNWEEDGEGQKALGFM